ncbi:MAG: M48 family metallopeptidase, partial [Thermoanaerobaculia bacterium]
MSDAEFEALVGRLEEGALRRPGAYRRKVLGLAVLGYGYVLAVLAILLAALAGLAVLLLRGTGRAAIFKLAAFLAVLVWVVLRALWVRLEPPQGLRLTPERAPRLFAELEGLRQALDAPPLHAVLFNRDFNASIAQVPRLGGLGWHRNFLTLGLPLLQALSPEQLRAVLAHEWGHLSRTHGRFGAWIYRI